MVALLCVNDRPGRWPMPIRRGSVYTEVERYRHCPRAVEFVRIAEHEVPCPRIRYRCRCGRLASIKLAGMFAAYRFRPLLPPGQLGVTKEEVRKLYNSHPRRREKEKA